MLLSKLDHDHHHDPLRPHAHDPNPTPPSTDPAFVFVAPDGTETTVTVQDLKWLPQTSIPECYIVSTGHGTSGPFTFSGVQLLDLIRSRLSPGTRWSQVEVISADGFGNRVMIEELLKPDPAGPALVSYMIDGRLLTREQGLVRLIVPSEKDDALRQVKWIGRIVVRE
jgi:hypothetical protein